jgi:hypothetical protein
VEVEVEVFVMVDGVSPVVACGGVVDVDVIAVVVDVVVTTVDVTVEASSCFESCLIEDLDDAVAFVSSEITGSARLFA